MPYFLAMMVRALRAVNLVANSGASLLPAIQTAARAPGTVPEATPLASSAREQTANSEFATSVNSRDISRHFGW